MCKTSLSDFCKRKNAPSILWKLKVRYVKLIQLFTKGFQIFVQHFYVHQCNAFQPDDSVSILCDLSERVFAHRVEDCPILIANVFLFLSSQQFFQFRNFNRVSLMCHGILLLCQGYVVYLHYQDIEKGHSTFGFCRCAKPPCLIFAKEKTHLQFCGN